jgi:hypothetical protein
MNNRYFACTDCRIYLDAGYRWCYWQLEQPAVVQRNQPVNVDRVLAHATYWNPPKDQSSDWLYRELLPTVRQFLADHRSHPIIYLEDEEICGPDLRQPLTWLQIGYGALPTPRYFAEILKMRQWEELREWLRQHPETPDYHLWATDEEQQLFRAAFEAAAARGS